MEYWLKRLLEGQAKVADKTIEEIEQQLKKYYRHVMETTIADFEATYDKLLATATAGQAPTPADLYKLDKYWKTQAQLKKVLQELGDKQIGLLSKRFEEVYGKVYSALALPSEEVFSTISQENTRQMINQIWCADGKSWSQRVWANTDRLQQSLNDGLIDCVVGGKKTSQLVKELRNDFQVSYYRANTIVKTEVAHIQTQASKERYKSYGVQEVEIFADPDNRTCPICSGLDGKKYNINEPLPIPAHPNCRCCILPVIEVEEEREPTPAPANSQAKNNLNSTGNSAIIKEKPVEAKQSDKYSFTEEELNHLSSAFCKYGTAINVKEFTITHGGTHVDKRLAERGITLEDAQSYIDNAILCFQQTADKTLYLSENGVAVALDNGGLATAYPKEYFDEIIKELLKEVLKKCRK